MEDNAKPEASEVDIQSQAREWELQRAMSSRLLGGSVCAAIAVVIVLATGFDGLGTHSWGWTAILGFLLGAAVGERTAFIALGMIFGAKLAIAFLCEHP